MTTMGTELRSDRARRLRELHEDCARVKAKIAAALAEEKELRSTAANHDIRAEALLANLAAERSQNEAALQNLEKEARELSEHGE